MSNEMRLRAAKLYRPPFRYHMGYVWDANGEMVADNRSDGEDITLRIRGWGRIRYQVDGEELQDEVGTLIAETLTKGWPK